VFKCGPDFLDPTILAAASGSAVYQLDLWLVGEKGCRYLLRKAAQEADLILVEGVMGLFDGSPSAADLAEKFSLNVLLVIDARSMAQSFGAVALGLKIYRPSLKVGAVLANRVAGDNHARLVKDSLPPGLDWYGALRRGEDIELPSRHLGLVAASELKDIESRINLAALELDSQRVAATPPEVFFETDDDDIEPATLKALTGLKVAVAYDQAFSFIYQANLDLLKAMGAQIIFFSPLAGHRLPSCQALYLPGGYPELHLEELSANRALMEDIKNHHCLNLPILAECGGLLYLLETLSYGPRIEKMVGLLPGRAVLTSALKGLGLMSAQLPEGLLRGHSFHHSSAVIDLEPLGWAVRQDGASDRREAIYRLKRLTASYVHFYWPSNPMAVAALFSGLA
jgi:cobyrinic acid a,c-diamide synthase